MQTGMLKSMPERNFFLQGVGEYKARGIYTQLYILVPEVVPDFSPREKERALTSELRDSFSPLFARFQHLTNISVIMYETVSP